MSHCQTATLHCHPATISPSIRNIEVQLSLTITGGLLLAFRLKSQIDQIHIPAPQLPAFVDGLWEHTCFEAFIAIKGNSAYREFNFSPSGQWAAYVFSDYRQREKSTALDVAPEITVRQFPERLELDAILAPALLPSPASSASFQIGLAAVVEATDGSRSYWALTHHATQPDFHHRDGFILSLTPPETL